MTMTPDDLAAVEARAAAATEDGWAIWTDVTDGGFIHVGTANGVIPEGAFSVPESEYVNPVAKVYTEEDAEFITHARTDVPALVAALREAWQQRDEALARLGPDIHDSHACTCIRCTIRRALTEETPDGE